MRKQNTTKITVLLPTIGVILLLFSPSIFAEISLSSPMESNQDVNQFPSNIQLSTSSDMGFILDQYQIHTNNHRYSANGWYLVQSFKPSMSPLTKIDVLFEIKGYRNESEVLTLSIKEKLDINEPPLALATVSYSEIDEKEIWIEFYFNNVTLTPEKTYYLFLSQQGFGDCYWYGIYNQDYYQRGYAYGYNMGTDIWENLSDTAIFPYFDFCFKTYSYGDNNPPVIVEIDGPLHGKSQKNYEYTITSVDDENDQIFLFVDWGDETTSDWIGPYHSSDSVHVNHTWVQNGMYTLSVRAKDDLGNLGDWTTMELRMSKTIHPFAPFDSIFDFSSFFRWIQPLLFFVH